jgi:hypothetical protein
LIIEATILLKKIDFDRVENPISEPEKPTTEIAFFHRRQIFLRDSMGNLLTGDQQTSRVACDR